MYLLRRRISSKKSEKPFPDFILITEFAFPNNKCLPAESAKLPKILFISDSIALKLRLPITAIGAWKLAKTASGIRMLMPKAPVNENCHASAYKGDVWASGHVPRVQSVAIP